MRGSSFEDGDRFRICPRAKQHLSAYTHLHASGVHMFFLSVHPPIWAGPDWTGFMFGFVYVCLLACVCVTLCDAACLKLTQFACVNCRPRGTCATTIMDNHWQNLMQTHLGDDHGPTVVDDGVRTRTCATTTSLNLFIKSLMAFVT